jgi:CspA family cold shock protein
MGKNNNGKAHHEPQVLETEIVGKIKFFNKEKGYGFIKNDGDDIFCHAKSFTNKTDADNIRDGQDVIFDIVSSDKGSKEQAANIRFI